MAALPVDDLYIANVLVASEDEKTLNTGARAGLVQVLIKVSGDTSVESSSLIRSALRRPQAYYVQYGYESTDRQLAIDGELRAASNLRIHFEPSAVAQLLRQAGYPVWGSNRPAVMLWLVVADAEGRRILTDSDRHQLLDSMVERAALRGIPLLFPILDLEDQAALSAAEVWGGFRDKIAAASRRYNADVILSARVQQDTTNRWSAQWLTQVGGRWQLQQSVAATPAQLVPQRFDGLADELAGLYALDSSRAEIALTVEAVGGLQSYAEVSRYLTSLAPVVDAVVTRVQGDEVEFLLRTEGQLTQLQQIIALDEKLLLVNADDGSGRLYYRWLE